MAHAERLLAYRRGHTEAVDSKDICIRFGRFHSRRQVQALDLLDPDMTIRIKAIHYNTPRQIERLIEQ